MSTAGPRSTSTVASGGNGEDATDAGAGMKADFFSMFYLPSSQSYDEDLHLSTSSYTPSFQGAATAVMGGILSVLDTALAVLNEDFDNPSDSIISDGTKDYDKDTLTESRESCKQGEHRVMGCCRQTRRSKSSASESENSAGTDKSPDNLKLSAKHESENNTHNMCHSIERVDSIEKEYFTPQNSLIGSISTLQIYEEGTSEIMKKLVSNQHSTSMNDLEAEIDNLCKEFEEPELSGNSKEVDEEPDYCIISKNKTETKDGWLVVSEE